MTPQWFLDLDGMKSGPYLTSEILGLMTEGKVLPHHRVSPTLEFGPWITVMDWRLQQAGSSSPPQLFVPRPSPPQVPPKDVGENPPSSADPVAELFHLLQNSKQRRENRGSGSATSGSTPMSANSSPSATPLSTPNVNEVAWAGRGLVMGIILLGGFVAGQIFKMSSGDGDKKIESNSPVKEVTSQSSPANTGNTPGTNLPSLSAGAEKTGGIVGAASPPVQSSSGTAIVEKKIDKFTIRAEVPAKKPDAGSGAGASSVAQELEDLRAMKQELEDIKKLREELKNATKPNGDGLGMEDYPDIEGYETLEAPQQTAPTDSPVSDGQQPAGRSGAGWR